MADGTNSSFYEDDEDEDEELYRYGLGAAGDLTVRAQNAGYRRDPVSPFPALDEVTNVRRVPLIFFFSFRSTSVSP